MGIGLSGLISGMDTDSIVKAMVSAQRTKATKIENKITKNKWTTDIWSSLNTKIYSFYTKYASKLRLQSSYMTRKATSSNESVVKATAGTSAAIGTHRLEVRKLASSQYVTGDRLTGDFNRNTKLTAVGAGVAVGTVITIKGKAGTANEKEVKLDVNENTTIDDFLKACKSAGLTASYDTTQKRFYISSSQSGKDDKFTITTEKLDSAAVSAFNSIDSLVAPNFLEKADKERYESAMATLRQNAIANGMGLVL